MNDPTDIREIDRIVAETGRGPEALVPILHALQERYHYIPEAALRRVGELTGISAQTLAGVVSFYPRFRLAPAGKHFVRVCIGTACHVKGAGLVWDAFRRHLALGEGEDTDREHLFTLEKVACLGCCMLAPVVQMDDLIYGHLTPEGVPDVLRDFLESRKAAPADPRRDAAPAGGGGEVRMCMCSSCDAGGARAVRREMEHAITRLNLAVSVRMVGCTGVSYQAPLVEIRTAGGAVFHYGKVRPEDASAILERHFRPTGIGRPIRVAMTRFLDTLLTGESPAPVTRYAVDIRGGPDATYLAGQVRIATEHAGELDPLDLDSYIRRDGFNALDACLAGRDPDAIIRQIRESGLRGRGGAGFPTGEKWDAMQKSVSDVKYIIANGDEGDPGAFMDRMILESFPFRVIEGMAIAAWATGAREGYLYIRAEYPLALRRTREALAICAARGFLGDNIRGSGWSLHLAVAEGGGAFVCGEETALIAALEGKRGMPRFRPPFPAERGFRGKPTLINNIETLALVPWIIRHGPAAFAAMGTAGSKGTKAFALAGKVARGGLIEVPMGMTIRDIVGKIGGGIAGGKTLKAVQVGGPSGGCVPAALADTPVDYDALARAGAIMGSGGLVVLDDTDCMVDIARYFLAFTQNESCGKCTFCRVGTKRMLEILERLCRGKGKMADLAELERLANVTRAGSLCGLGKTAPNPVLSTLTHFRDEFEAHVAGRCPAKKCRDLITYSVTDDCIGCTRCAQRCPADAIEARPYEKHFIEITKCTRCGTCLAACKVNAIRVE
ncbi:MAG: NAD(P)H-dependent oxidoreductase subunit E [Planctomycetota bacterium]